MCGIHASICTNGFLGPSPKLKQLLCNRGPDYVGEEQVEIDRHEARFSLSFTSTVLALRGGHVTSQPFVDPASGSILCWNGEAWRIGSEPITGNDGQLVFNTLLKAISTQDVASKSTIAVLDVLKSFSGPFAFVFFDRTHEHIFFGRDCLGRRSLLFNTNSNSVEFSSTADPSRGIWKEVDADAVYVLSPSHGSFSNGLQNSGVNLYPSLLLLEKHIWGGDVKPLMPSLGVFNRNIPSGKQILNSQTDSVNTLRYYLCESLKLRILNIPVPPGLDNANNIRVAVLFSGGLDCAVLARMMHDLLPQNYQIDLLNVAFENPRVIEAARNPPKSKKQIKKASEASNGEYQINSSPEDATVSISPFEVCPDRETGRKTFRELNRVCPTRIWRFVAVNVPYTETVSHRTNVINLIHPHNTEMDLSIAYALYFASRGQGMASSNLDPKPAPYVTPARVLLSGLGADELFGGYTRHATAFNRKGFPGLLDELELDVNRLGKRNLGRDDRVISHWGREARFPYLDEALVKWAVECPIWEKCGFQTSASADEENPEIEPGKKVLRLLAHELGMHSVAHEKKRAIQFGSRTAKMEMGRTKGTTLIS